ncbi:ABC transporter permease [Salipiger sp.]|uniref:ABC transporter permease n=1 Tax=Salipiger sp. TaxID=2078585 RepID=UPI003A979C36
MNRNGLFALLFHTVFILFILAPLVMVVVVSFTPEAYLSLPWNGLSLRWFAAIADHPEFVSSFWMSLLVGFIAATSALVLSIPAALAIGRYRFPGRDAVIAAFLSPLIIPHVVLGVAFLRFYSTTGFLGTISGLVVAHVIIVVPFALRMVLASVTTLDRDSERAAASLGATPWRIFTRITIPLILPGIAGGWIISFLQSFDEVTMTVFLAAPGTTTLPVRLLKYMADTIDPLVASVSTVVIVLTFLLMFLVDRLYGLEKVLVGRG